MYSNNEDRQYAEQERIALLTSRLRANFGNIRAQVPDVPHLVSTIPWPTNQLDPVKLQMGWLLGEDSGGNEVFMTQRMTLSAVVERERRRWRITKRGRSYPRLQCLSVRSAQREEFEVTAKGMPVEALPALEIACSNLRVQY